MMCPVPPRTVSLPARCRIKSFGLAQPLICPLSSTPISFGALVSQGVSVMASTASAPPTPIAMAPRPPALGVWLSVPSMKRPGAAVGEVSSARAEAPRRERTVVFEDDLMDDTTPRLPELYAVLLCRALQEVEDLLGADDASLQVRRRAFERRDEMVRVDRARDGGLGHRTGRELQQGHLRRRICRQAKMSMLALDRPGGNVPCIATRSGFNRKNASPRTLPSPRPANSFSDVSSSKWLYRIFSAKLSGLVRMDLTRRSFSCRAS